MKKLMAFVLGIIMVVSTSVCAFADETTRPSISISEPSAKLVNSQSNIRFTISLASVYDKEVVFNPSLIKAEGFAFYDVEVIKISKNIYDVIFKGVYPTDASKTGNIVCLKGVGFQDDLLTYQSPKSASFFIYDEITTRKEVADYLMRVFLPENERNYDELSKSGLLIGNGKGDLALDTYLSGDEAYIVNRRIEIMK